MSNEEFLTIERFILKALASRDTLKPRELIEQAAEDERQFSPGVINRVMWHLVGEGQIGFTQDWQLTVK